MTKQEDHAIDIDECAVLLAESNRLYSKMLHTLNQVNNFPEADSELQILKRNASINDIQELIEKIDGNLKVALKNVPHKTAAIECLLEERKDLLKQVHAGNRAVLMKIESVKSLLADEIKKFKTGHTALQGYRQSGNYSAGSSFKTAL